MKSNTGFPLEPKSVTLDDLEWHNGLCVISSKSVCFGGQVQYIKVVDIACNRNVAKESNTQILIRNGALKRGISLDSQTWTGTTLRASPQQ